MSAQLAQRIADTLPQSIDPQQLARDGFVSVAEYDTHLLTVGVPNVGLETQQAWIGVRVVLWPRHVFESRRVAVMSSRLGRKLDEQSAWFDAFRTLACQLESVSDVLLTVEGTTASPFVQRASQLFGLPMCAPTETEFTPDAMMSLAEFESDKLLLSAPILEPASFRSVPVADRLLAVFANHVRCLAAGRTGNTREVLLSRLRDEFPVAQVLVAHTADCGNELVEAGAVSWVLISDRQEETPAPMQSEVRIQREPPFDDYLLHWTRRPDGPWPDEDDEDYLDKLILGVDASNRSAFAALCRILQQGRLVATSKLIRGGYNVVCFSDIPLHELPERRTYRRHLHRWDYEPYGVAIRRQALQDIGTTPVIYGPDSEFDRLEVGQQPYFQAASTGDGSIDWASEREWRQLGDVNLGELPTTDVFAFVPTEREAAVLGQLFEYPVVVLEAD